MVYPFSYETLTLRIEIEKCVVWAERARGTDFVEKLIRAFPTFAILMDWGGCELLLSSLDSV
jgi:hypothetical protein